MIIKWLFQSKNFYKLILFRKYYSIFIVLYFWIEYLKLYSVFCYFITLIFEHGHSPWCCWFVWNIKSIIAHDGPVTLYTFSCCCLTNPLWMTKPSHYQLEHLLHCFLTVYFIWLLFLSMLCTFYISSRHPHNLFCSPYLFSLIWALWMPDDICLSVILNFIADNWNPIPVLNTIWKLYLSTFEWPPLHPTFTSFSFVFPRIIHFILHGYLIVYNFIIILFCVPNYSFRLIYQSSNCSIVLPIQIFFKYFFWYCHPFCSWFLYSRWLTYS